jgi:hypothetical protein
MSDTDIHIDSDAPKWSPAMTARAVVKNGSLIDADGEVRTLSLKEIKSLKSAKNVLPASLQIKIGIRKPKP